MSEPVNQPPTSVGQLVRVLHQMKLKARLSALKHFQAEINNLFAKLRLRNSRGIVDSEIEKPGTAESEMFKLDLRS